MAVEANRVSPASQAARLVKCSEKGGGALSCTVIGGEVVITDDGHISGPLQAADSAIKIATDGGRIEKAWVTLLDEGLLFVAGLTNEESSWGRVGLVAARAASGSWSRRLDHLGVGPPTLQGGSLFLTGRGAVERLDAKDGSTVWRLRGLSRTPNLYESFDQPEVRGDDVAFPQHGGGAILLVKVRTGEIVQGAPPPIESSVAITPARAEALLAAARASAPSMRWEASSILEGDFDGDGNRDLAIRGRTANRVGVAILLFRASGRNETWFRAWEYGKGLPFAPDDVGIAMDSRGISLSEIGCAEGQLDDGDPRFCAGAKEVSGAIRRMRASGSGAVVLTASGDPFLFIVFDRTGGVVKTWCNIRGSCGMAAPGAR